MGIPAPRKIHSGCGNTYTCNIHPVIEEQSVRVVGHEASTGNMLMDEGTFGRQKNADEMVVPCDTTSEV